MKNCQTSFVTAVVLFLATAFYNPAMAATLTEFYRVNALASSCLQGTATNGASSGSIDETTSGCDSNITSGSFSAAGSGSASYSTLRASASIGMDELDPSVFVSNTLGTARAGASYRDFLTIDVSGRDGEEVQLVFNIELNGSLFVLGDTNVKADTSGGLDVTVNDVDADISFSKSTTAGENSSGGDPGVVNITLGTSFQVDVDLGVFAQLRPDDSGFGVYTGDASSNFASSGGITSFSLFDLNGAEITDFDITSESGSFGFYEPVGAVPIPAAAWLFGSGLIGLVGMARRKKAA